MVQSVLLATFGMQLIVFIRLVEWEIVKARPTPAASQLNATVIPDRSAWVASLAFVDRGGLIVEVVLVPRTYACEF